jgi:molybdopterin-guanine dinucleotide biosynthesis protein A
VTPIPGVSAVVLAGGASTRFGRDKLAERPSPNGPSLLERSVGSVREVAADVVVALAPDDERALPDGARRARDAARYDGPLAGLAAGLAVAREPLVVVVAGDMPTLQPTVLAALVRALAAGSADAAALRHRGRAQPLPIAVRDGAALPVVDQLLAEGERRLGAVLERLTVRLLDEAEWRPLDPTAATLRDVDVPDDLLDV